MRFMLMFKPDEAPEPGTTACKAELPEMARLLGELKAKGVLLSSEGLQPSEKGARVRQSGGKVSVLDGPFAEAKELIAGVAMVEVKSKQEAIALAKRFLEIAGGGEGEVREVVEPAAEHAPQRVAATR